MVSKAGLLVGFSIYMTESRSIHNYTKEASLISRLSWYPYALSPKTRLAAPARITAGITLQTRSISHHGEVGAF